MKYQPYRDEPYQRECEDRYQPIYELCKQYHRPFSVLDIGCNYAWFGHRIVNDFPNAVYFGIDNKPIDPHPRIWHIKRHIPATTLCDWSGSDHFDIVLGLSVLHHFPDYHFAYNGMLRLGEWSIYEIPGEGDDGTLNPELHEGIREIFKGVEPYATFPSHKSGVDRPMYVAKCTPFISEQSMDVGLRGAPGYGTYKLHCDFDTAIIEIDRTPKSGKKEIRTFAPGMNLHNFRLLGGEVEVPKDENHPDDAPWNYILSDGIVPIDGAHIKARHVKKMLDNMPDPEIKGYGAVTKGK